MNDYSMEMILMMLKRIEMIERTLNQRYHNYLLPTQLSGSPTTLKTKTKTYIKGLTVNYEECQRKVPSLTSSNYGSRKPLEAPERKHVRVATVKSEFYNDSRISLQHK